MFLTHRHNVNIILQHFYLFLPPIRSGRPNRKQFLGGPYTTPNCRPTPFKLLTILCSSNNIKIFLVTTCVIWVYRMCKNEYQAKLKRNFEIAFINKVVINCLVIKPFTYNVHVNSEEDIWSLQFPTCRRRPTNSTQHWYVEQLWSVDDYLVIYINLIPIHSSWFCFCCPMHRHRPIWTTHFVQVPQACNE